MAHLQPISQWRCRKALWNLIVIIMLHTSLGDTGNVQDLQFLLSTEQSDSVPKNGDPVNFSNDSNSPNSKSKRRNEREGHVRNMNSIGIEEEEAIIFKSICIGVAGALRSSFRFTALAIRRTGDTIAGIISGVVKVVAGAFKLSAEGIWIAAMRLAQPRAPDDRMPHLFDHAGRRVAKVLRTIANVFFGVSEACILTGETFEALTTGLGQAVQDSFSSLELLCSFLQQGFSFLLHTSSDGRSGGEGVRIGEADEFHYQKRQAVLPSDRNSDSVIYPGIIPRNSKLSPKVNSISKPGGIVPHIAQQMSEDTEKVAVRNGTEVVNHDHKKIPSDPTLPIDAEPSLNEEDDNIDKKSTSEEESKERAPFFFDLRPIFHTIGQWERYLSIRTPSDYLSYYIDIYSMLLLLLHMCWSWMCGPWIPYLAAQAASGPSSSGLKAAPMHSSPSWVELMGLQSLHGIRESTHNGAPLLLGLLIVAVASSFQYRSVRRKMSVIGSLVILIWLFLIASEHVSRTVLATRTAVNAVNSLMLSRVAHLSVANQPVSSGSTPFPGSDNKISSQPPSPTDSDGRNIGKDCNKETDRKRREICTAAERERVTGCGVYGMCRDRGTRDGSASTSEKIDLKEGGKSSPADFETSVWINVIMSSLWVVERGGGLGPYISQSIQEVVNQELALVPPGIANIQLKKFTLGTQTPIIQAVKVQSKRASICITPADQPTSRKSKAKKWGYAQEVAKEKVEIKKGEGLKKMAFNSAVVAEEQENVKALAEDLTQKNIQSSLSEGEGTGSKAGLTGSVGSKEWSQWREWQSEWDRRRTKQPSSTTASSSESPLPQNSTQRRSSLLGRSSSSSSEGNVIRRPGGGSGCERLVVDLDVTYVSRDMDIILTLRSSDVHSVLPEATVTLSGVVLAGILRLDAELTPDYPFFGNATVSAYIYSHLLYLLLHHSYLCLRFFSRHILTYYCFAV